MGLLTSCEQAQKQLDSKDTNMLVAAPYQEPCLQWADKYKTLLNCMADRGFAVTRVAEDRVEYEYLTDGRRTETAAILFDKDKNYVAAEVMVDNYLVTPEQVRQFLEQNYVFVTTVSSPATEYYFRSKVAEDSIQVMMHIVDARPVIEYTKTAR